MFLEVYISHGGSHCFSGSHYTSGRLTGILKPSLEFKQVAALFECYKIMVLVFDDSYFYIIIKLFHLSGCYSFIRDGEG